MKRRRFPPILIVFSLALLCTVNVASRQESAASSSPDENSDSATVPAWMAWRVFHDSLKFYSGQSVTAVNDMLAQKFGLTTMESETLLKAGESFLGSIDRIDTDVKAELLARYGRPPALPRNPQRRAPVFPTGTIFRQQGKTVRDLAVETGLFAEVEGRKQVALTAHIEELGRAMAPMKLSVMSEWVQTNVRPRTNADQTVAVRGIERSPVDDESRREVPLTPTKGK